MSDLISRQDAIKAMCYACGYDCTEEDMQNCPEHYELTHMPSAEPKTPQNGSITCVKSEKMHVRTTDGCISRQDAIDAVEFGITYAKAIDVNTGESKELFKEGNDALKKAVERLKELPSAEPERKLELHGDESAIEILSELRSWFTCFDEKEGLAYHALSLAIRAIKANSIVQAERKKGKWMHDNPNTFKCSKCNKYLDIGCGNMKMNFCPNCGADMRGEEE